MTREVQIGGRTVTLRATASLPVAYRALFRRDLLRDVTTCYQAVQAEAETEDETALISSVDILFVARLAYCMAKSADPSIPDSMSAWLETIDDPNALYTMSGPVIELYSDGFATTVEAKKNLPPPTDQ